jgi:hypothetical protein
MKEHHSHSRPILQRHGTITSPSQPSSDPDTLREQPSSRRHILMTVPSAPSHNDDGRALAAVINTVRGQEVEAIK